MEAPWPLHRLSREYADWVLAQNGGDKQRAAEIMGIDLSTLYCWRRQPDSEARGPGPARACEPEAELDADPVEETG